MEAASGIEYDVLDIAEAGFAYVVRNASASAVDAVRVGDYLVASTDVSSQETAQMLLDCRVRRSLADALVSVAELEANYRASERAKGMAFEVWHVVADAAIQRVDIYADYAEVEDGRIEYKSGRFQDLAPARAYVREKWQAFVACFDDELAATSRMGSFGSYQDAFSVRIVLERVYPLG